MRWNSCGRMISVTGRWRYTRESRMFHSRWRIVSIVQSHAPTNRTKLEAKEEFFEQLKAGIDNSHDTEARHNHRHGWYEHEGRERKHTKKAKWVSMALMRQLRVIESFKRIFNWDGYRRVFVKSSHTTNAQVWRVSPNRRTHNEINHVIISSRWRSSLQDARVKHRADKSSDHDLLMAKVKIRMAKWSRQRVEGCGITATSLKKGIQDILSRLNWAANSSLYS